uniref:Ribosomal protein S1 n=1 Tax=Cannabis sativa TaxID=3483 RepID=A0A803R8T4_CANSA
MDQPGLRMWSVTLMLRLVSHRLRSRCWRAAARFNDMVGSMAGESIVLPRRFRQNRAWLELNKMSRTNAKVKGFIVEKVRGGYSVAIAGFIAFLPFRVMMNQKLNDRFTIESINPKSKQIVVFF